MGLFNTTTMLSWISGLIFAFFFVVLYTNTKRTSAKCYALIAATCAIWSFSQGTFYLIGTGPDVATSEALLLFFNRLNHFSAASIGLIFFYFSLLFPEEKKPPQWVLYSLLVFETFLAYAYFTLGEVIHDIYPVREDFLQYGWHFGKLGFLFHLQFIPFFLAGVSILYYKLKRTTDAAIKSELGGVVWATGFGALAGIVIAVILPLIGEFTIARFAPASALIWVGFMSYAIFRYKALPVKLIAGEISILGLIVILFANIFIQNSPSASVGLETLSSLANIAPGAPLNIYSTVIWISAIILASFGLIIYLDSTRKAARAYALVTFIAAAWAAGTGAFLFVTSYEAVMAWAQFNHFVAGLIAPAFFYFAYLFPEEKPPSQRIMALLVIPQIFFLILYLFTNDIIFDSFTTGFRVVDRGLHFGPLGFTFHLSFLFFFVSAFFVLFRKALKEPHKERRREFYALALSSLIGVGPAGVVNLLLPTLGYFGLYWLGPIATLIWVVLSAYVIVRYHVLSVKLVFAEASVLALGLILFANVFISENASFGGVGRVLVFLMFSIVGGFFIRSIIRGDEQTDMLERLSKELADLNNNLQKKVSERTKEIESAKIHVETIIENLTSGLIEYENDFNVRRINRSAERLLGIKREEVVGMQILPYHKDDPHLQAIAKILHPPEYSTGKSETLTISSPLEVELQIVTAPVIAKSGSPTGFIKVLRDVTRERLIARSKSEFISIAAHQLRTPLSIIKWTLSVLLEGDKGTLPPTQQEALGRAYTTNERMIGLVNDLLDVARIEDGRFGYEMQRGTLPYVIQRAMSDVAPLSSGRKIQVSFDEQAAITPEQTFDPDKLRIAFRGLIDNAVRYTPESGVVDIVLNYSDSDAIVTIADSGIGVPEAEIPRLFTKFYRSANAVRVSPDGSGLALFIVNHIIKRHGGTIEVKSEEHVGTTMTVRLPLDPAAIPEKETREEYV